jgi:flagellar motor switch protein FliM
MEKILSQDEINALFSAMSSEELDLGTPGEKPAGPARKIAIYDFHRADRISQDQMRSIHMLHDFFGRSFSSSLSAYLRAIVDISLISVDQISYSEFLKLLPDPTLFSSIGMRPLESNIAIEMNPSLVFPMIDMLLGGPGTPTTGVRNPTEIEMNIIEGVIKQALRDLAEAWRSIMEIDFYIEGTGTKAHMFQIVSPGETVVAVGLEIKVGEASGMMNICIPSRMLKVMRNKFDQQWNVRRQRVSASDPIKILNHLRTAGVELSSEIRNSSLTVDDLLKLTVGDVIQLDQRIGDPLFLCIGSVPKFMGQVIMHRGKRAFEIGQKHVV